MVFLHTMEFIQPHFLWLDLTVEGRKLLCHTSQAQKDGCKIYELVLKVGLIVDSWSQ